MNVEINSLSSGLIWGATLYRNQEGVKNKLLAPVGYACIALISTIETIAALVFSIFSLIIYSFSSTPANHLIFNRSVKWVSSSIFSIGRSLAYIIFNFFVFSLVADEKSAFEILRSGNLMMIPPNAVV